MPPKSFVPKAGESSVCFLRGQVRKPGEIKKKHWNNGVYPEKPMSFQAKNSRSGGQNIVETCPYLLKTNGIKNVTKCHSFIFRKCFFFVKDSTAYEIRIIETLQNHTILCFHFKPAGEIAFLPETNKNQVLPTGSFHYSGSQNRNDLILPPGVLPTLNTRTGCSLWIRLIAKLLCFLPFRGTII